jgi:hypothetical protein
VCVFFVGAIQRGIAVAGYGDTTIDLKLSIVWYWVPVIIGFGWALICVPAGLHAQLKKGKK